MMQSKGVNKGATQIARAYGLDNKTMLSLSDDLIDSISFDESVTGDLSVFSHANYLTANMMIAIVKNLAEGNFQFQFLLNSTNVMMDLKDYAEVSILRVDLEITVLH